MTEHSRTDRQPSGPGSDDDAPTAVDLAQVADRTRVGLAARMGIEVTRAERGLVEATMPVEGNTQPMGLLHGGASAALAETVGSVAAMIAAPEGHLPVGVDLNATHHRSAREGSVTATARALHEGRRASSYAIEVRDEAGRLLCSARLTCQFVAARA
ncbi:hotdog fold thioesterase [Georgenia sp. Z1344]|uniref:hotdog fold thioesterase n=1 Tax=Georgenia sp. Z1344 TaxID=3416706 RepID=UPI003CE82EC9